MAMQGFLRALPQADLGGSSRPDLKQTRCLSIIDVSRLMFLDFSKYLTDFFVEIGKAPILLETT